MTRSIRVDFISDISCPWCIIGLRGLEEAAERLAGEVTLDIRFRPFELNPDMPRGGENLNDHVARKLGRSLREAAQGRQAIVDRAAQVDFPMVFSDETRIYNTFDAHRLLHWAGIEGKQHTLKRALFAAHFTRGEAMDEPEVLAAAAAQAGLDGQEARAVLAGDRYAREVREEEQLWRQRGVQSVPAIVLEEKYLISGGQPADLFEQALRQVAGETAVG